MESMLRMIIDRDCHVSMSNRKVIRHVVSRLKKGYKTFADLPKDTRREFMRLCVEIHRDNFELYRDVMTGNL